MTQYNTLNVKLANSQLHKLKSAIQNETEVVLNLSSNLLEILMMKLINFPHKLLLTDREVPKIREAFANDSLANIKFSKTELSQMMIRSGGITGESLITTPHATFLARKETLKQLYHQH